MKHFRYQAFGITIRSDIELPMLLPAKKYARTDVEITKGRVNKTGFDAQEPKPLHYQAVPGKLWLKVPMVGRFLVTAGNKIKYQAEKNAGIETVRLFLLGDCMGALLQQRQLVVLRAMAFVYNDKAVAVASYTGDGKTTLAAVMHKYGYKILCDDICAINEQGLVLPGYPVLKLWRDCFRVMKLKPGDLQRVRPQLEKYAYPLQSGFVRKPLPLVKIYTLSTANDEQEQPEVNEIVGMNKLAPLQIYGYRQHFLIGFDLMDDNMKRLIKLAGKVNMATLVRPRVKYRVIKLIKFIIADLKHNQV